MNVRELIDMLRELDPDLVVELALVAPVDDEEPTITVDRFVLDGVLVRQDEETGDDVVWLIGGEEESDLDAFYDAIDPDLDDDHQHPN